jgi:multicomponent Na+:H+ antiporter subunit G
MSGLDLFTVVTSAAGLGFFFAGTVGLLRFQDTHSRLHALTKADNLGLGLIVLGLLPQTGSVWLAAKLVAVWALALLAAATAAQLVARTALPRELPPVQPRTRRTAPASVPAGAGSSMPGLGRGPRAPSAPPAAAAPAPPRSQR